ncbi:MAG: gliding motility-associated C-terminal domain-containing protein [Bacteroidales bacterium]|nr:gliding motility-associated C-terminal domain-containing protein [Bacteroidales bacterium]
MKKLVMLLCAVVISIFSYSQQPPCQDFTVVPDINARWNEEENRYEACSNSPLEISANGVFPNNDAPNGYHQSDGNLNWTWSWVDEHGSHQTGGTGMNTLVTNLEPGAYYINMYATDQNGCRYVYPEPMLVVVSLPPTFTGTAVTPEICPGEAVLLEGHVQPPDLWVMEIPEQIVEQHCFVDETGYVQSMCFEHNAFAPGQLIQSANDIESIAIDMEHSYLGDLEVWITCPSGNRLTLFDGYNGGSDLQFLGEPIDDDYDPCNPGTPYHYTWSHNATSTIEQVANNAPTYSYTDNAGNHYYGEEYIPAGDYRPTGDWSSLVGCPVNGEWCINIQDHRHWDDGVVFSVELHFADYLIPIESLIRFQTEFASSDMTWDGGNIIGGVAANTTALPNVPGQHEYVFSATDNFGCTYDTTLVVTVRDYDDPRCCITPSTTILTSTGNVCSNRTSLSARPLANGNTGEWSVVAYPNGDNVNNSVTFTSPNAPNTQVVVNGWGTYTFRWIEHYMGLADCIDFADVAITFNQQPNANFTYTPISCFGGETSIAYTGNMSADAEFSWNFDGGFVQYGATPLGPHIVSWPESGTHGVTLRVNNHGCVSNDTLVSIFVPDKLVIDSISVVNDPCYHSNAGSAVVAHHGGTLPVSYSWAAPGNELLNLGVGNYTLSVTDANGCVAQRSFVVTEPAELVIQSVESANLSCYASHDGTISVYAGGGTGELQYMWSDVGVASADRRDLPAGEYSVTVSDVNGCSQSAYVAITQPERFLLQLTSDYAVCEGEPTPVYANAFGGTSPYRYFWNAGDETFEAGNGLSVGLDVTTHYSVFARDAHNCVSETQTMTVTVSPKLSIDSIILQQIKCYGHCNGRAELVVSGGLAPLQYSWPSDNYVYDGICSGYYAVTVTDRIGCSAIGTFVITQPNDFVVSTSVEPVTCNAGDDGRARIFVSGATPPYSYLWPDGTTSETLIASAGSYTVTVLDDYGCRYTENLNIEEPLPIMYLPMNNVTICKGQSATLTTQVSGGTPFYDYAWSGSDGTQYFGSICTVSPTTNSTYSLTITDSQGCSVQVPSVTVSINPDLRIASVLTNHDTVCAGDEALIYVEADGGNGGPYTLMLQDGRVVASPFSVRPDTTTMYYITLSDMCGTPSVADSIVINVYPSPDELFVAEGVSGCVPLSVAFSPLKANGTNYLWRFGDNDFSEDVTPVHIYRKSGDFDVTMSVTNEYGCRVERTIPNMIHAYPHPKALFDAEVQSVSAVSAEVLFTNRSVDAVRYFWFFGDSDSSMFENPRHLYPSAGEYDVTLVAENEHYCTDTTTRRIMVYNEFSFYAPTSFTPNGDGINDCFRICGSGISKNNFLLMVYDRWGELIFRTTEYDPDAHCDACSEGSWDGTDMGNKRKGDKVLPNGVYQWYCQFEDVFGIEHREQGAVNLAR